MVLAKKRVYLQVVGKRPVLRFIHLRVRYSPRLSPGVKLSMLHKRVRMYMLVPDPDSLRKNVSPEIIRKEMERKIEHLLSHPIYGVKVKEFIDEDFSRLLRDPPSPPDLPEGFTYDLINAHNWAVKQMYRFSKPSAEYSFMVRVPLDDDILKVIDTEIKLFIESSGDMKSSFDQAIALVSKIVELGLVAGMEIWPEDIIEDLRTVFLGKGIDPREIREYYSFKRTGLSR